jgi:ABC-type branched-subunit amino acid transport system substrate-binding protein
VNKWWISKAAAGLVLGLMGWHAAHAEPGISESTILIGQAAGFTGTVAGSVKEQTAGANAYFELINARGGVHGRKIKLESLDDGFDPKRTPDATRRLIEEKNVFALFLYRGTPTTEAAYPIIEQARIPLIAPSTGAKSMHSPPKKYLFPVRSSYHSEAAKIVEQLTTLGMTKIAVVYVDDSFGKDGLAGVQNAMKAKKLDLVATAGFPRGTSDVAAAVKVISEVQPQAVIMLVSVDSGAAFVKQMNRTDHRAQLITLSNVSSNAFVQALGEDGRGVGVSQVSPYPFTASTSVTREFLQASKDKPAVTVSYAGIEGFIAAKVLVEGLRRAGPQPTREKLIAGLESLKRFDLGGIDVTYGPEDRTGTTFVDLTVIGRDGKFLH